MNKRLPSIFMALFLLTTLASCNESKTEKGPKAQTGDLIYEEKVVFDTSNPTNISVKLEDYKSKKISSLSCGRAKSSADTFTFSKGILTISKDFFTTIGSGEKTIQVAFSDNTKTQIDAIIATKVITTAQEFQAINDNLKGIYVLGNDIDLSSIPNFEPLGKYYEETDIRNDYFHGILEGNGYTIKNAQVYYCNSTTSSEDVYNHNGLFKEECHKNGDNIGLFQIIGSSGVVRNVRFDNIKVRGRTIVGVIAGNCSGVIENCIVTETCSAQMGTHFYDNDCNMGGVVGIVAGSGSINNVVSLTSNLFMPDEFIDYSADYIGKSGNGWDHPATAPDNSAAWWKFAGVDRDVQNYGDDGSVSATSSKETDSNGSQTNGIYAFAGKTWGTISNSLAIKFNQTPYKGTQREVYFTQTHLPALKKPSGDVALGTVTNCFTKTAEELKDAATYASFDTTIWNVGNNAYPTLKFPLIASSIKE